MIFPKPDPTEKICEVCHQFSEWYLIALELEGTPVICAKCVFHKLTGNDYEWRKE